MSRGLPPPTPWAAIQVPICTQLSPGPDGRLCRIESEFLVPQLPHLGQFLLSEWVNEETSKQTMATSSFCLLNSETFTSVWATLASPNSASWCWTGPPCCPSMSGSALYPNADPATIGAPCPLTTAQAPRLSPGPSQTRDKPAASLLVNQFFLSFSFLKKKKLCLPLWKGEKESWFNFVIETELHLDTLRNRIIFYLSRGDGLNKFTIEMCQQVKIRQIFLMIWNAV